MKKILKREKWSFKSSEEMIDTAGCWNYVSSEWIQLCFYSPQFYKNTFRDLLIKAAQIIIFRSALRLKCKQLWDFLAIARSLVNQLLVKIFFISNTEIRKTKLEKYNHFLVLIYFRILVLCLAWMKNCSRYPVAPFLLISACSMAY